MTARRLARGGAIDRSRKLTFLWEGRPCEGFAGDTLASALLASGRTVLGRSFKYHRPRGLMAAGVEEPNVLVQLGRGARTEANPRATEIELHDGLSARPVNCWPGARFDIGAALRLVAPFIPAGFYYKTFMRPDWKLFEPWIRRAAGLGRAARLPDPDRYAERHAHCDVLVVGAGPAGLAAALAAARRGERVILAEQDPDVGGALRRDGGRIDGLDGPAWAARAAAEIAAAPEARLLTRTTAIGYFDHGSLCLIEKVTDHLGAAAPSRLPRQRAWHVRAARVVLATGALERPLVFPGNDRPGVMLAGAVRDYVARWAVLPGEAAVVFTNNDGAYATAHALIDAGGRVVALADSRPAPPSALAEALAARGTDVLTGAVVTGTRGAPSLSGVAIRDAAGRTRRVAADLLAVSGGWNPSAHLFSQSGGRLAWDAELALFKPGASAQDEVSVGAAAGTFGLAAALAEGWRAGGGGDGAPSADAPDAPWTISPLWRVDAPGEAFVDFQSDVSAADVELAHREAFVSVEHLKRYTTLGMATDQGKTSNVNALALMAELTGRDIPATGTTRFRPPFTPTAIGALAGGARGELFKPRRLMPAHARHAAAGAVFEEFGGWQRPACYPRPGESRHAAEQREALAVRQGAGLFDASPLGEIEVAGPDAAAFLDRVYANAMSGLKPGRLRYGLMLDESGAVMDDGVVARLAPDRFLVGTTGAGADRVAAWLDEWLQCEWPDMEVLAAPLTTARAVLTLSGPKARAVLEAAGTDIAAGPADFPHMTFRDGTVAGVPARVSRVSFTGEVSFEIAVPADRACELWDRLTQAGAAPAGVDAWMILRTEKGYVHLGADTDGSTSPDDIGFGRVLRRADDFIGRRSLTRPENLRADRHQLVGLEAVGSTAVVPAGCHLRGAGAASGSQGYITSSAASAALGRGVALGMVRAGRARMGEELEVVSGDSPVRRVRVAPVCAYDPAGERLLG